MTKRAVIAGGSGFIGHHLAAELSKSGYDIVILSRSPKSDTKYREAKWDAQSLGDWVKEVDGADAIFNLTGAPIEKNGRTTIKKSLYNREWIRLASLLKRSKQVRTLPEFG